MDAKFVVVKSFFTIDFHPSALQDIQGSLQSILQSKILTYSPEHSGIVLAFYEARVLSRTAPVHAYFPYFHVRASAKLLIFHLVENQVLDATVDQVGKDYIGLKVLGGLGAVIHKDELTKFFKFSTQGVNQVWQHKDDEQSHIQLGSRLRFTYKRIDTSGTRFIIVGAVDENSSRFTVLSEEEYLKCPSKKKIKKRKTSIKKEEKLSTVVVQSPLRKKHKNCQEDAIKSPKIRKKSKMVCDGT